MEKKPKPKHLYVELTDEEHIEILARAAAERRTIKAVVLAAVFPQRYVASVDPS